MSNSTWVTKNNTASAFKVRANEAGEFNGDANIDEDPYRVTVEAAETGPKFTTRDVTFVGKDNGLTFSGKLFDSKRDSAAGQEADLEDKRPRWTGTVKCAVNDELTVEKRVSVWVKKTKKGDDWLSFSIKDNVPYQPGAQDGDQPF